MKTNLSLIAAVLTAAIAIPAAHAQNVVSKKKVALADSPAAVQEVVKKHLERGKLDDIEAITRDGSTLYKVEIDLPGDDDLKLYVTGDGALIRTQEEIRLKDVPAAVQDALKAKAAGGGKVEDVVRQTEGQVVTYLAEIDRQKGPDLKLVVDAAGKVLKETEDHDD